MPHSKVSSGKEVGIFHDKGNGPWHAMFNACANSLHCLAKKMDSYFPGGMDYVKINVILFCVLFPIIFLASLVLNLLFLFDII